MNTYCEEGEITDAIKFASMFPDLANEPQREIAITTSVHCELTLLLHSMANTAHFVKIGVSKHCCWLCEKYIEFFQNLYKQEKKVLVAGFQGKIHSGWLLPPGTPTAVEDSIQKLLKEEMNEIRAEVEARRRGDSWPAGREEEHWLSEARIESETSLALRKRSKFGSQ